LGQHLTVIHAHKQTNTHTQHNCVPYCFCVISLAQTFCYSTVVFPIRQTVFTFHTIGSLTIHKVRRSISVSLEVFLPINHLVHLISSDTIRGHNWMITIT